MNNIINNPGKERGLTKIDWLTSYHSFSFGNYFNKNKMGFGKLKVFNDDYINPLGGFGTHAHKNMEIISVVLSGQLEHKDSLGNNNVLNSGDIQVMTAGSGIFHSEYNPSDNKIGHFYQIWIEPENQNLKPSYFLERAALNFENKVKTIVSGKNGNGLIKINQEAEIQFGKFSKNSEFVLKNQNPETGYFFILTKGNLTIGETSLSEGDSMELVNLFDFKVKVLESVEFLIVKTKLN